MYYFSGIGIYKKYDVRLTYRGITFTQDGMNSLDSSYVSYREGGIKSLDEWKDILKEDYKIMKFNLKEFMQGFAIGAIFMYVGVVLSSTILAITNVKSKYLLVLFSLLFFTVLVVRFSKQLDNHLFKSKFKGLQK